MRRLFWPQLILGAGTLVGRHGPALRGARRASHYLRALAVGDLSLAGSTQVNVPAGLWTTRDPACNGRARATCFVPRCLGPHRPEANRGVRGRTLPAAGVHASRSAARLASNPQSADRAGRLVLVATRRSFRPRVIVAVVTRGRYVSLLGLIVAMTPMVIFVSSMLSNSALETAAGLTFAAAIVRLARPGLTGHGCGPLQLGAADFSPSLVPGDPLDDLRGCALLHPRRSLWHRESVRVSRSPLIGAATV